MYIKFSEEKPKLSLDIDGVLGLVDNSILELAGTNYTINDITSYDKIFELIGEATFWKYYYYLWKERQDLITLVEPNSPELVKKLLNKYDIEYVSKRPESTREGTEKWLYEINNFPKLNLVCVKRGVHKADLDYSAYIDDNELMIEDFADGDKKLFLFTEPWNESIDVENNKNVKRIYSLKDLL
jgi:5'(3')-deoxyribonucleotidase